MRWSTLALLVFALSCGGGAVGPPAVDLQIDNLLFVTIDTLRADHVGANGYARQTTPNIDRLARSSAVFTQAIAQSSWTRSSVASLVTGMYPTTVGLTCHNFREPEAACDVLPRSVETLAEVLEGAGFRTGSIVANINVDGVFGFDQGYQQFSVASAHLAEDDAGWRQGTDWFDRTTVAVTEQALAWLDERGGDDRRFLLNLHYLDPHDPYEPPEPQRSEFAASDYGCDPRSREAMALYDGEIRHVDLQLARVLERLEQEGLSGSTAVVIVSDHGEEFHEHGGVRHGFTMFDEQLRVPFVLRLPGLTDGGVRIDDQVRLVDVMPTLLGALDLETPGPVQGRSLLPLLAGGSLPEAPALSEWGYRPLVSWRAPPWKLIYNIETEQSMLFHLEDDPQERVDLAPDRPRVVERMLDDMTGLLSNAIAAGRGFRDDDREVVLTQEQRGRLEALGYVDGM